MEQTWVRLRHKNGKLSKLYTKIDEGWGRSNIRVIAPKEYVSDIYLPYVKEIKVDKEHKEQFGIGYDDRIVYGMLKRKEDYGMIFKITPKKQATHIYLFTKLRNNIIEDTYETEVNVHHVSMFPKGKDSYVYIFKIEQKEIPLYLEDFN